MAYANDKGAAGERECAEYLSDVFKEFGHKFVRIGGTEKGKKLLHGDVIIDYRTDKDGQNFLRDYFLEVKVRASMNLFDVSQEATENAQTYGKHGAIVYAVKQGKGHKRDGTLIVLTPEVFKRIIGELQGWREEGIKNRQIKK